MMKDWLPYHPENDSPQQRHFLIQIFLFLETEFLLSLSKARRRLQLSFDIRFSYSKYLLK